MRLKSIERSVGRHAIVASTWLVTGGLGFIGSAFIRTVLNEYTDVSIVNFDAMTYAGCVDNLVGYDDHARYSFIRGDICDAVAVSKIVGSGLDAVINFAAETHVDRSIRSGKVFLTTDVLGTFTLLEAARRVKVPRFLQVSTDEVYGDIAYGSSKECDLLAPRSPYAASKAGADLQVLAQAATYGAPVLITRGSNTFGPYQHVEKLIPLFITRLLDDLPVPVYGDGLQIRDWIHVDDHVRGILTVLHRGNDGGVYNIGGDCELQNLEVTARLVQLCGRTMQTHVRHISDRLGHDRRYSTDSSKLRALDWAPRRDFATALEETVEWYRKNEPWWRRLKSEEFSEYYKSQYLGRDVN